ncbi:methyl-accepting chemotaxis protein [Arenibacterium sp. LLYu02]|uniref:methyl-accepting chemotaxis protein n=1 Tax=Arenibacterium sp. LLYu02 TaxID=3404132 RepID=UPI003B22442A
MSLSISIRTAILFIVGLASLMILSLIGMSFYTHSARDTYQEEAERMDRLDRTIVGMEVDFLQARRAEKDFLLRLDEKYVDRHRAVIAELTAHLDSARKQSTEIVELSDKQDALDSLQTAITSYAESFLAVVETHRALGLDETQGLQGHLRNAVHQVEESLKSTTSADLQAKMLMMRRHEKDFIMRQDAKYLDRLNERVEEFKAFPVDYFTDAAQRDQILTLLEEYQASFQAFVAETLTGQDRITVLSERYAAAEPQLLQLREDIAAVRDAVIAEASAAQTLLVERSAKGSAVALLIFVLLAVGLAQRIAKPLLRVKLVLEDMLAGTFDTAAPKSAITEVKAVCTAIENFRKAAQERDRLTGEINKVISACAEGDFSRRIAIEDEDSDFAALSHGVNTIGEVVQRGLGDVSFTLDALSKGDLTERMPTTHKGVFAEISVAVDILSATLTEIVEQLTESSVALNHTANEIAAATTEASRRGEGSAASLEETAGAIQVLSDAVNDTASNSRRAHELVKDAQTRVSSTLAVAEETTRSITRIKEASEAISKITDLIEGVSFQTNLLALNAGVEAARAGEAGAGFAVVASEVRALAKRSAEATQEINQLIRHSSAEVTQGVDLVGKTGSELDAIRDTVVGMVAMIDQIAAAAVDQSSSLREVNTAVTDLDKSSQQNAAMLEQTAASTQLLRDEAEKLVEAVKRFKTSKTTSSSANLDSKWRPKGDPRVA